MTDLKLLIFGAGAIGTYVGSSLLLSGEKAIFVERPATAAKIKSTGMRLIHDGETRLVENPPVYGNLAEALDQGPFDAVLVAVKSYDTAGLAEQLTGYRDRLPPVICLQNGVENEALLETALGEGRVIPATLTSAIGKPGPGTAVVERLRGIGVANVNPVCSKLVEGFNQAGLQARLYADAGSMKWSKLLTNLLANATSAILDMSPAEIYAHPGLYALEARQFKEALAVMRRLDVQVVDLPGTPVRLLALMMQLAPPWLGRRLAVRFLGSGRGGKMPSFHIDLYSGSKKSEVEYLNGAVSRFGAQFGIPTPVNRFLADILQRLITGAIPMDTYRRNPEKLLQYFSQS